MDQNKNPNNGTKQGDNFIDASNVNTYIQDTPTGLSMWTVYLFYEQSLSTNVTINQKVVRSLSTSK